MQAPHGRAGVIATFGIGGNESSTWYKQNIISQKLPFELLYENDNGSLSPVKSVRFHYKAMPALMAAFSAIWAHARMIVKHDNGYDLTTGQYDTLTHKWLKEQGLLNYGGTFEYRPIRGSSNLSMHSYGIAIDMAPGANKLGEKNSTLPAWFVQCFKDQGFFWGGDFEHRLDKMHFQMAIGV